MEYLHGPKAQIVLEIKEGDGFTFSFTGLVVVASFKGVSLETEEIPPSSHPKFDSSLIWEVDTKYLRKLRSSNTALKVEFFSLSTKLSEPTRERIGYVHLNLKEANIGPTVSGNKEVGSWHRLLYLKRNLTGHKPEVYLSFRIQEIPKMNPAIGDIVRGDVTPEKIHETVKEFGDWTSVGQPMAVKPIQIGPSPLCTELYQLTISFLAFERLIQLIPPEKIGQPFQINFAIFGTSISTNDISTPDNGFTGKKITFDIWSRIEFLSAYFREFPTLVLSICCSDETVGTANLNLQVLSSLNSKKNIVINSTLTVESVNHTQDVQFGISEGLPSMQVAVDLIHKIDYISTKMDQEIQTNQEKAAAGKNDAVTNTEDVVNMELLSTRQDIDHISGRDHLNEIHMNDLESENTSIKSLNITSKMSYSPKPTKEDSFMRHKDRSDFVLRSPQTFRLSNSTANHPIDLSKEYVRDVALRACEELEDWKEKQQQMFEFELKKKTDRRLKKLSSEWAKHKKELEDDLKNKIEDCRILKEKLVEAFEDLTSRTEAVSQQEYQLELGKAELDKKYTTKFQELRKASRLCEYDMEDKINLIKSENSDLKRKLDESSKEIRRLQTALLDQGSIPVSKDDANDLASQVKSLQQKLDKALESKVFFKEQWGKAVRELHRMKENEQQQLKIQIQKNRQELQTLGLVKEISEEVGEMKKDQFVIKNIRNELSNFFPSNDSLVDVNCFSGT